MNERIRELAKQARQIGEYGNYGQIQLSTAQFEQKFAELIVKECVETLGTHEDYWTHEQSMAELKKHFGIKE